MFDDGKRKGLLALIAAGVLLGGILLAAGTARTQTLDWHILPPLLGIVVLLVTVALVAIAFFSSKNAEKPVVAGHAISPVLDRIEAKALRIILFGGGILLLGTFGWAGTFTILYLDAAEIVLPIVIIAGVTVLLIVLGLLTFAFSVLGLSNPAEALGLPSGTVRAVIALMLLVIFAIVAIFLYSDVATNGHVKSIPGLTSTQLEEATKQVQVVTITETQNAAGKTFTLYYRNAPSAAAQDLAKQLIVLLGTLVTAVASFYFGSSSVAAAMKPTPSSGGPNAVAVTPGNLNSGGGPQSLTISGTNLGKVGTVKLTDGKASIQADPKSITANETSVDCKITVPGTTSPGPYDVVVFDNANNSSSIPKGVSIVAAAAPSTAPPAPTVTGISPNPTPRDGAQKQFTITGSNLSKVTTATFAMAGETSLTAANVTPQSSSQVICALTIPPATRQGQWDVVVSDGTTPTTLTGGLTIT